MLPSDPIADAAEAALGVEKAEGRREAVAEGGADSRAETEVDDTDSFPPMRDSSEGEATDSEREERGGE